MTVSQNSFQLIRENRVLLLTFFDDQLLGSLLERLIVAALVPREWLEKVCPRHLPHRLSTLQNTPLALIDGHILSDDIQSGTRPIVLSLLRPRNMEPHR